MIEFKILKKSKKSRARLGLLKTSHGVVETPSLVPVATQAVIKTLTSEEVLQTKSQILICNTFHLHLKPGEEIVKKSGGLHEFMNWQKPLMTDSGGFQVFSLGFGKDLNLGKVIKSSPSPAQSFRIEVGRQPISIKINQDGVHFRSPLDGKNIFLGPKESIKIQEKLGADIIFAFDECTPPLAERKYIENSLERTHKWAKICLESKKTLPAGRQESQALFGITQGSNFKDLRVKSAKFINSLGFDGFGIGGDLGESKQGTKEILEWTIPLLEEKKPRHLLGIGYLEDMENIIKGGIDLFDCTVPTHYARRGIAFVGQSQHPSEGRLRRPKEGRLNLNQSKFLKDMNPLDKKCDCFVCQNYKRNYICHLFKAKEITALKLLTFHNLYFFNSFVEKIRDKIKRGGI